MNNTIRGLAILLIAALSTGISQANTEAHGNKEAHTETNTTPRTLRLTSRSVMRSSPNGQAASVWDAGTLFTSRSVQGQWIRVSGHFPGNSDWKPSEQALWVPRQYTEELSRRSKARPSTRGKRPADVSRYIVVDKKSFELKVIEKAAEQEKVLLKTTVALGMDRCLPKEKGGRCYYTDPGEYKVRWKVHDPEGIEWCIPKAMEKEYPDDIAAGKRCFRGAIGSYALNIGKSYAIHGTNKPYLLGKRISHGCVRAENTAMERIYALMENGDKVIIVD